MPASESTLGEGLSIQEPKLSSEQDQGQSPSESPLESPEWRPTKRLWIVFSTMCIITLMAALDATSLPVALPILSAALNGTAIEAFWSGTSFLLTSTVFQPNFALLSDIFGRKALILFALLFFTLGAILASVASSFTLILVGRSIQGVGAGGVLSLTEIIVTDLVPLRERGKYFGIFTMMWAVGSVSGPIMGGAFAQNVGWEWIFWINLPFCLFGLVGIPLFLKLKTRRGAWSEKVARVDWGGSVLFVGSVTAVLIPVTWGGVMYEWDSWRTLVPLCVGALGLVGFVVYEKYVPESQLIRLNLFNNRTAVANYYGTFIHGVILWCLLYYLPLYYEAVKGLSPIMTGVAIFPQTFTVSPASIIAGILISMTGRFRWAIWSGWALTTFGIGLLALLDVHTTTVQWIFLNIVSGLGAGVLFPSMMFAAQAAASDQDMAYAVSIFSFFRSLGQSFGVAIGGVVFQNSLRGKLAAIPGLGGVAGDYAKDSVALVQLLKAMPDGEEKELILVAYVQALRVVWYAMVGFAASALVVSFWVEGLSLDRALNTEHGLVEEKEADVEKTI